MRIPGVVKDYQGPLSIADWALKLSISETERKVLAVLQEGFPRTRTPYSDMARRIGIDTAQLLGILRQWKRDGKLRRIGAIINHFKVGIGAGAMVVWQVEPKRVVEVGRKFAGFPEVSHAYERTATENWQYNVYTMVHGVSRHEVQVTVARMSEAAGVYNCRMLFTEQELKKVPPTYILESES